MQMIKSMINTKNSLIHKILVSLISLLLVILVLPSSIVIAEDTTDYLCFTAEEANSTVKLTIAQGTPTVVSLETSTNKVNWTPYTIDTVITLANIGDKVYFRNTSETTTGFSYASHYYEFVMSGKIAASGDVTTLINKNGTLDLTLAGSHCFGLLFQQCTSLTKVPNLSATVLTDNCYAFMFHGCTSLTSIPENLLPAITLTNECYDRMFMGCTGLTSIPGNLLPAMNLAVRCYYAMFSNCTAITSLPENLLPATNMEKQCYVAMFDACDNLSSVPENLLPSTNLAEGCYSAMFAECINLQNLPKLPAIVLAPNCYGVAESNSMFGMFQYCKSLTYIPDDYLPSTALVDGCYVQMFSGCTGLTSIPENLLPATVLKPDCYAGMFSDCTGLKSIPNLPATTLADSCYYGMFERCSEIHISDYLDDDYSVSIRVPSSGFITIRGTDDFESMFAFTGGPTSFTTTGTPVDSDSDGVITLYMKPFSVTITYNGNGNDGGTVPTDSGPYMYGDNVTIKDNVNSLTKTGYIFNGWNTKADGTGTTYQSSDILNITGDITLYAIWENPDYSFTLGSGQTYTKGTLENKLFTCDGPLANLTSVQIDGNEITETNQYTKESGSTKITLLGTYLETLDLGSHTLKLTYSDGPTPAVTFNVVNPTGSSPDNNNNSNNNKSNKTRYIAPNTGID